MFCQCKYVLLRIYSTILSFLFLLHKCKICASSTLRIQIGLRVAAVSEAESRKW